MRQKTKLFINQKFISRQNFLRYKNWLKMRYSSRLVTILSQWQQGFCLKIDEWRFEKCLSKLWWWWWMERKRNFENFSFYRDSHVKRSRIFSSRHLANCFIDFRLQGCNKYIRATPSSWEKKAHRWKTFQTNCFFSLKPISIVVSNFFHELTKHENLLDNIIKPNSSNLSHQSHIFNSMRIFSSFIWSSCRGISFFTRKRDA